MKQRVVRDSSLRLLHRLQSYAPCKIPTSASNYAGKEDALLPYRISRKTYTKFSHILQSAIPCQSSHKSCIHFTNWSRIITARWIFHQILYYFFAHQNIIVKFAIDRDYAKTNNSFSKTGFSYIIIDPTWITSVLENCSFWISVKLSFQHSSY